jgi:4-amino-4-deoxy-L-arabinose transferase-like glycosyltransferase
MARVLRSLWTPSALGAVLIVLWLRDVMGPGLPAAMRAPAILLLLGAAVTWLAAAVTRALRTRDPGKSRTETLWVIALLALALVLRFTGLDFELVDHPVSDEGVYLAASERINAGEPFPDTFNYGHFLYYSGALVLWVQESLPGIVPPIIEFFYGVETTFEHKRIALKAICALLGALTVPAVFAIGRRVAGVAAGAISALLIAFSPLYNDISHQLISDVPSGYFAALCMVFVARLLKEERLRDYLLAGVAAGLAAGSKYPGGVVAIAIFGIWLWWRIRERQWSWSLLWSGLSAIATMLAVMPALVFAPGAAFSGTGLDIFFGFRQYAFGGWLGVQPESAAIWYGKRLLDSFGFAAVIVGLAGTVFLERGSRGRLLRLLPFPVFYLTLISAMSMVVERNLQPLLPMLAVLLGVGTAGWFEEARRRRLNVAVAFPVVLGALVLFQPALETVAWDVSRTRDGTRQLARTWIEENLPDGVSILREGYTSRLDPERYHVQRLRFAAWMPDEELFSTRWDFLLLARNAHGRFLRPEALTREHEREYAERYRKIFDRLELVREWRPSVLRAGAHLMLYRVEPLAPEFRTTRTFMADDATWVSNLELRREGPGSPLTYTRRWQYGVFKEFLEGGTYDVSLGVNREPDEGYLYVLTPFGDEVGTWEASRQFQISLPGPGKYLFRVFLAPPAKLTGWIIEKTGGDSVPGRTD